MTHIALITDGIWPYVLGGMQKHSYYLCKYFASKGIHVDLIHFNQSTYDPQKLEFFTEKEKVFIHSTIIDFPNSLKFPGHYIYNSYRHSKLIFDHLKPKISRYDFIYTKGFTGWYLIDQKFSGKIECCKIGVNFHGYEMFQKLPEGISGIKSLFLRRSVKKISRQADVVFSYGGKITNIIRSIGVKEDNIIEVPSAIEKELIIDKVRSTCPVKRFVYLGRYERRKGIEELSEALRQLLLQESSFEFHFIGPIPEEKKLIHKNIIYHGEIRDREQLLKNLRSCDVLLCPSYSEGFPNVILEAMSNGLAVVATPVGAVELLVNEKVGWLIENSNVNSILSVLKNVLNERENNIDEKKINAIRHIRENFTWDKIIEQLITKISQ